MASYGNSSTWCLCDKLPRSILHSVPTPDVWCRVCGKRRRPRACVTSSSDEEEQPVQVRQEQLKEEKDCCTSSVRVNIAINAKKPNFKLKTSNKKVFVGRVGQSQKPQGKPIKSKEQIDPVTKEDFKLEVKAEAKTPTPLPSPAASVSPTPPAESLWEQPKENLPNLVALAHEVFNRPQHLRQRQLGLYDQLFVSDFIPLNRPITDVETGAISKRRRRIFGRPLGRHYSRPLPPLSEIITKQQQPKHERIKGGGLAPKKIEADAASSQFEPFDRYDGPSEDALVVESAWQVLQQPKSLQMTARDDLPSTLLSSFESEPSSSDTSSSSAFQVPSAPPAEPTSFSLSVPLRLDKVMQSVAKSNPSDTSASSGTTSSRSSGGNSPSMPPRPESALSRGGDLPTYNDEKKKTDDDVVTRIAMESLLYDAPLSPLKFVEVEQSPTNDNQWDFEKDIVQLMGTIDLSDAGDSDKHVLKSEDVEEVEELRRIFENPVASSANNHLNDMSNELPVYSTNKSAGDAKYFQSFSNDDNRYKHCSHHGKGNVVTPADETIDRQSVWSLISRFFVPVSIKAVEEELKPLKSLQKLHYGTMKPSIVMQPNEAQQSCQKCGLYKKNVSCGKINQMPKPTSCATYQNRKHEPNCIIYKTANSNSSNIKTSPKVISSYTKIIKLNNDLKTNSNSRKFNNPKENCTPKPESLVQKIDLKEQENNAEVFIIIPKKSSMTKRSSTSATFYKPCVGSTNILNLNFKPTCGTPKVQLLKKTSQLKTEILEEHKQTEPISSSVSNQTSSSSTSYISCLTKQQTFAPSKLFSTSSSHFESCFTILSKDRPKTEQPQQESILEGQEQQHIKTFENVRFASSDLLNPSTVRIVKKSPCFGQAVNYVVKPAVVEEPVDIFEFRTLDIQALESTQNVNDNDSFSFETWQNNDSKQSDEDSISLSSQAYKKSYNKKAISPAWPAHPLRNKKRRVKHKAIQNSDENLLIESKYSNLEQEHDNEMWIDNEMVQQKIKDMMTKPIKLLNNPATAMKPT